MKKKSSVHSEDRKRKREESRGICMSERGCDFFKQEKNAIGDLFRYETANHDKLEE